MPLYLVLMSQALAAVLSAITPILLLLLLASILVAALQASLQLEDMALNLLPRLLLAIFLVLVGGGSAFGILSRLAATWLGSAAPLVHRAWN